MDDLDAIDTDAMTAAAAEAAAGPAEASADGQSAKAHPIPDQLDLIRHVEGRRAVRSSGPFGVLRTAKVVPPGAQ